MDINNHDVFISFSFKDQAVVERVVNQLFDKYRISYWMCTRELIGGEHYKEEIVRAIDNSKIVVVIQSENSIASREVPKEVSVALDKHKTVIPFVLDDAELRGDLEYDLIGIHRVDARRPTLEERTEDLARQIYAILNKKASEEDAWAQRFTRTRLVPTPPVMPKKVFCGRDGLISDIAEHFERNGNVLFLYGIGGIGKTQIAKQYAKQYGDRYDTVIFATYGGSIKQLVLSDSPLCLEPEMARFVGPDGTPESDDSYFERKLEKIKKITDSRTLIVIDNMDVTDDENINALANSPYHLLVTTRCDYSRHFPTIEISPIESMDDLVRVFMLNYGGYDVEEDDPKLCELIELVNRHTYTVELLAQHMEMSGQTPSEMIAELKEKGIKSLSEQVSGENMKKTVAYENLLKMFNMFTLSQEERKVLLYLSFMGVDGVNVRLFRSLASLDSTNIIKGLENKSWLVKSVEGIALHPIIREVVTHEIVADENNCAQFIANFTEAIDDKKMWQAKRSEKFKLSQIARNIMERFPKITPFNEDFYYYAQSLFSFYVDPELAVELADRLYYYHKERYGDDDFKTARAAFKRGWVHTFNPYFENSWDEAAKWLTLADSLFKNVNMTSSEDISRHTMTKTNLSKVHLVLYRKYRDDKNRDLAIEWARDSLAHAKRSYTFGDFHYAKIAGASMQLAEILGECGRYDEALSAMDEAIDVLMKVFGDTEHVDMSFAYYTRAIILYAMGNTSEALSFADHSARVYEVYFGETHPRLHELYLICGDCCKADGDSERALGYYEKARRSAELAFGPGNKYIDEVQERIKEL